jgi:hypothetical protein
MLGMGLELGSEKLAPVATSKLSGLQEKDSLRKLETVPAQASATAKAMALPGQTQADSSAVLGSESPAKGT